MKGLPDLKGAWVELEGADEYKRTAFRASFARVGTSYGWWQLRGSSYAALSSRVREYISNLLSLVIHPGRSCPASSSGSDERRPAGSDLEHILRSFLRFY